MDDINIKKTVREAYGSIVEIKGSCCPGGCAGDTTEFAKSIGYSDADLQRVPEDANLGLSCGNPTAVANLREGEIVLDLGSGAGFDCFVAAPKVGPSGKIIGVDMTPVMLEKARENARKAGFSNVEFRLGEIEDLPVADNSVDVVISNCVINLSADKARVFEEIVRVLKPGGRVAISDMALTRQLPEEVRQSIEAYVGCIAGALPVEEYKRLAEESGLQNVDITVKGSSPCIEPDTKDPFGKALLNVKSLMNYAVSVYVEGCK